MGAHAKMQPVVMMTGDREVRWPRVVAGVLIILGFLSIPDIFGDPSILVRIETLVRACVFMAGVFLAYGEFSAASDRTKIAALRSMGLTRIKLVDDSFTASRSGEYIEGHLVPDGKKQFIVVYH